MLAELAPLRSLRTQPLLQLFLKRKKPNPNRGRDRTGAAVQLIVVLPQLRGRGQTRAEREAGGELGSADFPPQAASALEEPADPSSPSAQSQSQKSRVLGGSLHRRECEPMCVNIRHLRAFPSSVTKHTPAGLVRGREEGLKGHPSSSDLPKSEGLHWGIGLSLLGLQGGDRRSHSYI